MFDEVPNERRISSAQWRLAILIAALMGGAILYRFLRHELLGQSAAMFLGIPTLLAISLALTPKAKTVTGGILKGITLALAVVAPSTCGSDFRGQSAHAVRD